VLSPDGAEARQLGGDVLADPDGSKIDEIKAQF
jgi:hypothetical protein